MPRMRSLSVVAAVWATYVLAGCTFLVSFDDLPQTPDAGPTPARDAGVDVHDATPPPPDVVESGSDSGPTIPITPACDTAFPLDQVQGCATFIDNAQVCADNTGLTSYPGDRSTDVVTCSKSGAVCVRHCVACAHNPKGFPDQCDQCTGKADGTYCGTDMGWQPTNFKLLVSCATGRMATVSACTNGCDSKGGAGGAACK